MNDVPARATKVLADHYLLEVGPDSSPRILGRGGMASVYLARDLRHGRLVAIKVLLPELAGAMGPERFLREIQIAARLIHPHIVGLIDSGIMPEESGPPRPYYVMPYIEGESLRGRLDRVKHLALVDAVRIAEQVLSALAYAHGQGVVHRDIKPENILLEGDQALVADFGVASALTQAGTEKLTETGLSLGTPFYMSPEQGAASHGVDGRSDLYSMGCVLYEMLAGQPPFTGRTPQQVLARHAVDPVPPLHTVRETVPPTVERAIGRALAKLPVDRFSTAEEFAAALSAPTLSLSEPIAKARQQTMPAWRLAAAGVALLLGAVVGAVSMFPRSKISRAVDPNVVAVAPFDVLDPRLELWREGIVDLLSRSLDGAGALRTVAPSVVVSHWRGRADQPSAVEVGRRTGAGLVAYGTVVSSGPDSVRLTATILDVESGRPLAEVELRNAGDRMDHLIDSLAVRFLAGVGRTHEVGIVRYAHATSLPALKAFLQGERHFRRMAWDSARIHFERAVELDSSFASAFRRLATVHRWDSSDSLFEVYTSRAAALNRGLGPRESLLVAGDSIDLAIGRARTDPVAYATMHRLLATWEEAARRYPDDPEVWYGLGEARWHQGPEIGVTLREQLDAFDRAIAIDSGFLLSEPHAVQLGIRAGGAVLGQRYAEVYLAREPNDPVATGIRAVTDFLQSPPDSAVFARWADSLEGRAFATFRDALGRWPDSAEVALRMVLRKRTGARGEIRDSAHVPLVARWLASRGHVREASTLLGTKLPLIAPLRLGNGDAVHDFVDLALIGAVPAETAAAVFEVWRRTEAVTEDLGLSFHAAYALPWWASRGDTATLQRLARRAESAARRDDLREAWQYLAAAAPAYLALARRDTIEALWRFLALPDSLCIACNVDDLVRARLLSGARRDSEAYERLRDVFPARTDAPRVSEGLWILERGRVAERLGDRTTAAEAYRWVAGIWRHADPELQMYVAEARAGIARLSGEGAR